MYGKYALWGALSICIYAIIQAPDYGSPNYTEWNSLGYTNEQARRHFEPLRRKWLPRVL